MKPKEKKWTKKRNDLASTECYSGQSNHQWGVVTVRASDFSLFFSSFFSWKCFRRVSSHFVDSLNRGYSALRLHQHGLSSPWRDLISCWLASCRKNVRYSQRPGFMSPLPRAGRFFTLQSRLCSVVFFCPSFSAKWVHPQALIACEQALVIQIIAAMLEDSPFIASNVS